MAQDSTSKTKEKKAQRDAERRQQKGKKRKAAALEDDQPESRDELQQDFISLDVKPDGPNAESNAKPKKRKRHAENGEESKSKKVKQTTDDNEDQQPSTTTKSRFIVFVGNLPYTATDDTIREHFKSLSPFTLRHRTDPKTKKSKGFSFLEFENYDRMKTCLKLFHHSMFGEGKDRKGKEMGRKINVELTAGGGGKAEGRKEKIRVKNQRLEEQRKRRIEQEKKEKARKERKKGADGKEEETEGGAVADAGIHPSRLAQMQA